MRSKFPGYYRPTEVQYRELWEQATIVLDANVLLNLYRYSSDTGDELLDILGAAASRLWLPHQAAQEFHDNRLGVIAKQAEAYADVQKSLEDAHTALVGKLNEYKRHPLIQVVWVIERLNAVRDEIAQTLRHQQKQHPDYLNDDVILTRVTSLFDGNVGDAYSGVELNKRREEALARYRDRIPPGFADAKKKDEDRSCGDYVLWHQVLGRAESTKRPILMVTEDSKEDWWWRFKGKRIGARPELVAEMQAHAGVLFHLYSTAAFMEAARTHLGRKVEQRAIDEARNLQRLRELALQEQRRARRLEQEYAGLRAHVDETEQAIVRLEAELDQLRGFRLRFIREAEESPERVRADVVEHVAHLQERIQEIERSYSIALSEREAAKDRMHIARRRFHHSMERMIARPDVSMPPQRNIALHAGAQRTRDIKSAERE